MKRAALVILALSLTDLSWAKVSLYLSSDQTEALYGIKTPGLYYITEGVVNKYAMNFQHQVKITSVGRMIKWYYELYLALTALWSYTN